MTSTNLKPKDSNVCACVSSGFEGGKGVGGEAVLPLVTGAGPLVNDPEEVHSCTYNMLHNVVDTINAQINAAEYTTTV